MKPNEPPEFDVPEPKPKRTLMRQLATMSGGEWLVVWLAFFLPAPVIVMALKLLEYAFFEGDESHASILPEDMLHSAWLLVFLIGPAIVGVLLISANVYRIIHIDDFPTRVPLLYAIRHGDTESSTKDAESASTPPSSQKRKRRKR